MTSPALEKLIRFQRPEKALPYAHLVCDRTVAALFGTDEADYLSVIQAIETQRAEAASRIAADQSVQLALANLPFRPGDRVIAIGESTTADRLSWFELLQTVIGSERPDLGLRFDNLAVSGASSTQALAALPTIRRQPADWVFCMLGGNDSQRFDGPHGPLLVSRAESLRNLAALRAHALPPATGRWVWITPTPVDEERSGAFPFFRAAGISWSNTDIGDLAAAIRALPDTVIDSGSAIAGSDARAFTDDGVHPSVAAHEALAAHVLRTLSGG